MWLLSASGLRGKSVVVFKSNDIFWGTVASDLFAVKPLSVMNDRGHLQQL